MRTAVAMHGYAWQLRGWKAKFVLHVCSYAYVWRDRFRQLPLLEAVPVKTAGSKGRAPSSRQSKSTVCNLCKKEQSACKKRKKKCLDCL